MADSVSMKLVGPDGGESAAFSGADLARAAQHAGGRGAMKESAADRAVVEKAYRVAADELRSFVERLETLEAEKKEIADQQKEVMAEAKGRGYDTRALRRILALRRRNPDEMAEEEAVVDLYRSALGMG